MRLARQSADEFPAGIGEFPKFVHPLRKSGTVARDRLAQQAPLVRKDNPQIAPSANLLEPRSKQLRPSPLRYIGAEMPVIISMLRGVNVGGHNKIKMDALRELYQSLKLRDPQTYVQSGNVVFATDEKDLVALAKRIQNGIERSHGFNPYVILRTTAELRAAIAKNPFAKRRGIEPNRLLVTFLAADPGHAIREQVLKIKCEPEEIRANGRELYIYFPNGMARPKLSFATLERTLKISGTGRNWNSVTKLLEMAEKMEATL